MKLSRMDRTWELMQAAALQGKFGLRLKLFPDEAKKWPSVFGVDIKKISTTQEGKAWYEISWVDAFKPEGLSVMQSWYMSFLVPEMPPCETPAQELFLLSGRNVMRH